MVKFGKVLEGSVVPEWRNQYVDYKGLKKLLKPMHTTNQQQPDSQQPQHDGEHSLPGLVPDEGNSSGDVPEVASSMGVEEARSQFFVKLEEVGCAVSAIVMAASILFEG